MISSRLCESLDRFRGLRPLVAILAFSGLAGEIRAQGFGPDPFRPYNSQYDSYVFGVAPGALDGVGNPSINRAGIRNANQFQNAVNEFGVGVGNRYDQANRRYDSQYNRIYRPNAKTDEKSDYEAQRAQVSEIYFRYLREKDPRKRVQLLREYNKAQSQVARGLAASPNSRNARRKSSDSAPAAPEARNPAGRGLDGAPAPPDETPRASNARAAGGAPPPPDDLGRSTSPRSDARRGSRLAPAPVGATPSEVLERATRSGDSSTAPPPPAP